MSPPIERILPREADLGEGLHVRRALPTRERRMIGAWCFLDHIGPVDFSGRDGMHVGAHPHTALQTFTWLIEGEILHRDSLGSDQPIRPGQVNLMTAGHGIVHTEDSPPGAGRLHAAQLWIALPAEAADCAPAFAHHPDLPRWTEGVCTFTLLAGRHGPHQSPARLYSPLIGLDIHSTDASRLTLPLDPAFEYGILPLEGRATLAGEDFDGSAFACLDPGRDSIDLTLAPGTRLLLIGGEPFATPIQMAWNFVGHSREAIATAQRAWEAGDPRFGPVPGSTRRLTAPPLPWAGV